MVNNFTNIRITNNHVSPQILNTKWPYHMTLENQGLVSQVRQLTSCLNLTSKNTETIASCKAVFEVVRSLIKGILYRCLKIMFMVYDMVSMLKYMCFWHFVCPTRPWFSNVIWYGHFVFSIWGDTWLFVILILVKLLTRRLNLNN
jgi:type III secretory pathway component EscU